MIALVAIASPALAQGTGRVQGRAYASSDRAPVAYALVRLVSVGSGARPRTVLSDSSGAFAFPDVPAGTYRLSLERIGFAAERTEPFAVPAGGTVRRDLGSVPRAVAIPKLVVTPLCLTGADVAQDSALAALLAEAQKGIETRRAFDAAYRYEFNTAQWFARGGSRPKNVQWEVSHVVMDPRTRVDREREGWGTASMLGMSLEIPDGREILEPEFLATHCIEASEDSAAGVYTLGFRPVRTRPRHVDIRGVLRMSRRTLEMETIQVEWLRWTTPLLKATVEYRDAYVPGGVVRLPIGAMFSGRPPPPVKSGRITGEIHFQEFGGLVRADSARVEGTGP
ncbi:MAG TPA: carboxypeptidase-like regulatory domain-containing protein [Longimicrobium sp.]